MKQHIAIAAALLLASPLTQAYSAQELAMDPIAYNTDDVCYIRGSVWSRHEGAMANIRLTVFEVGGNAKIEVVTDVEGFYEVQIAAKPGAVFRERLAPEVRRKYVQLGSMLPAVREPTFTCNQGRVSVGSPTLVPAD